MRRYKTYYEERPSQEECYAPGCAYTATSTKAFCGGLRTTAGSPAVLSGSTSWVGSIEEWAGS